MRRICLETNLAYTLATAEGGALPANMTNEGVALVTKTPWTDAFAAVLEAC